MTTPPVRVLLVDDDEDDFVITRNLLSAAGGAGYALDWAPDAKRAGEALAGATHDVCLLDARLAGASGVDVLRAARASGSSVPFVMLTGDGSREADVAAMEAGAADFLVKGTLSPTALDRAIRYAVEHARRAKAVRDAADERAGRLTAETAYRQLRLVADCAPVLIVHCDRDLRYLFVNRAYAERFGLEPEHVVGRTIPEVVGASAYERFREHVESALAGQKVEFEAEIPYEALGPRAMRCQCAPEIARDGSISGFVAVLTDVTDRRASERALVESEQRYRAAFEQSPVGMTEVTLDGTWARVNDSFCQIVGYDRDDLIGQPVAAVTYEPDALLDAEILARMRAGESIRASREKRYARKDGALVWVHLTISTVTDASGAPKHFVGVVEEITARKEAETAIRESERRFRQLADAMPQIVWTARPDGHLDYYNRQWYELTGRAEGDGGDESWIPVLHPDDVQPCLDRWYAAVSSGQAYEIEYRFKVSRTGLYRWHLGRALPVRDEGGRVLRWIGTCTDVDDQKRAAEALGRAHAVLSLHVTNSPLAVVEWDPEFRVVRWSRRAEELFGWRADEVIGKHPSEWSIVHEEDAAHVAAVIERLQDGREERNVAANRNRRKDGSVVSCEWYNSSVRTEDGGIVSILSLAHDVTERQRAEAERDALLTSEREARRVAEEASRFKDEFLMTLSHELRTPLTPMLGWLQMIRSGRVRETSMPAALGAMHESASALNLLIGELLDLSRVVSGRLELRSSQVKLSLAVLAAVEAIRPAVEAKGLRLVVDVDASDVRVLGDVDRLRQVVWNLVSNAAKFTPEGGRVEVRVGLSASGASAEMVVRDTGEGIDPAFLPHVFDRFRQGNSTATRNHGGLGLGLAIVRHLVELHGGTVDVESPGLGLGATFVVRLPAIASDAGEEPRATASAASIDLGGADLLVVDDDPPTREFIRAALEGYGACVRTAASAAEGFEAFLRDPPRVLVSDIAMPGEDGYALISKVRASGGDGAGVPAIALTAFAGPEARVRALAAGFHAHVTKPIDPEEFALVVASLLR